jgi:hypothetical protein
VNKPIPILKGKQKGDREIVGQKKTTPIAQGGFSI